MAIETTIVNLSNSLSDALTDIKSIETYIFDLRNSLNVALTRKKKIEKEYNYTLYEIKRWTRRAELAFINEKEDLVRVAIIRKKHFIYQEQKIKKQIEDSNNQINLLTKRITIWENEVSRNIITENKNISLEDRLSKLEIQLSHIQNEISDIATILCKSHSCSLYSDNYQFYHTKKMSVFDKLEVKVRELEREQEFIVELEGMSIEEQLNLYEFSSIDIDVELQELRAQLNED